MIVILGFYAAQNPNHVSAQFSTDCQQCHELTSINWLTPVVAHNSFKLSGNAAVGNCSVCHQKDFASASNHIAQGFPNQCSLCHSTTDWKSATFSHSSTPFQLTGFHATVACASCHTKGYSLGQTTSTCNSCHQASYATATNHISQGYPNNCEQCHNTTDWKNTVFNHSATSFPLTGLHATVTCASCHTKGYVQGQTSNTCYSCHQSNYMTAANHSSQGYPTNCDQCHNTTDWKSSTFNHAATPFPLTGFHTTVLCSSCHTKGFNVGQTQNTCFACHQSNYNSAANHASQGYPTTCDQCHNTTDWKISTFNHSTTSFPLSGYHTSVLCADCHTKGYAVGQTSAVCSSCHLKDYNSTSNPNHLVTNLPTNCEQCHTTTAWTTSTFNHATTPFLLTGFHATVPCANCHTKGYNPGQTPNTCYACHQANYSSAANHISQGYPNTCDQCHNTTDWKSASFNHSATPFPLTGYHTTVLCASCHTKGFAVGQTPNTCYACHQANYNGTTNPNHTTNKFLTTCEQCHNTIAWTPSTFNHSATPFPLTGFHTTIDCANCHTKGYVAGQTSNTCYSCHQANYSSAANHAALAYPTDCTMCHSTVNWTSSTFNHSTTPFPLTGYHLTILCATCHTKGFAVGQTSAVCSSCHLNDYNGTTNPNHITSKLPTTCDQCHNTTAWTASAFNHATTSFPLIGFHATVPCASCHTVGFNPGQTPNTCYGCHKANYTTAPNHVTQGYPTTCDQCHNPTDWKSATFNHAATPFPLTGFHSTVLCATCHTKGFAVGQTSSVCSSCHLSEFNSTTTPNHITNKFPNTCDQCHNTTAWTPSNFNHNTTPFPLTGAHISVNCASCHTKGFSLVKLQLIVIHVIQHNILRRQIMLLNLIPLIVQCVTQQPILLLLHLIMRLPVFL